MIFAFCGVEVRNNQNCRPLLKEVKNSRQYNILLDCKTENVLTILNQAKEVNLTEEYHSFILTSLVRITANTLALIRTIFPGIPHT